MNSFPKHFFISCLAFACSQSFGASADSLYISLSAAEERFLANNAQLLAQKLSIEESKANAIQASLWSNPTLDIEQNIYNHETQKYFPSGVNGENSFAVQQLFDLAGKRSKRTGIEETNTRIAEFTYYDLLRSLKYELRTTFFDLYYLRQTLKVYDKEIQELNTTVSLFQAQYEKGNIPQKDIVRLKAFLLTLQNERRGLNSDLFDKANTLAIIIGDTTGNVIVPRVIDQQRAHVPLSRFTITELNELALSNRYDLKAKEESADLEKLNVSLQKALGVPDVHLGVRYDRSGNYIPNYYAMTLEVDLPIFDRNQGAVQAAEARVNEAKTLYEQFRRSVLLDVNKAYNTLAQNDSVFAAVDAKFLGDFDMLIGGIISNYERGNINVVEFIDFLESYKNSIVQINQLRSDRVKAIEALHRSVGKDILYE
jgi:outer membrane protein, heavy metal efflux system